jgi:ABC-type sugar transport system ATPase subunit
MFLGKLLLKPVLGGIFKLVDRKRMETEAAQQLRQIGIEIPSVCAPVGNISGGQRKAVAISRAVYWRAKIIIMDEPTAALGVTEVAKVLELIGRLKEQGISVVFISHNLDEVLKVVDRIVVLSKGKIAASLEKAQTCPEEIIHFMVKW